MNIHNNMMKHNNNVRLNACACASVCLLLYPEPWYH